MITQLLYIMFFIQFTLSVEIKQCITVNYESELFKGMNIIHSYPHNPHSFTQGLAILNNTLFESTGLYGKSSIRIVNKITGKTIRKTKLPNSFFGEGIAIINNELFQLTWKNRWVKVYNISNLKEVRNYRLPFQIKEGWGMTRINQSLGISDGSDQIYIVNPETFTIQHLIKVKRGNKPLYRINDIEYINGYIFANIWYEDVICVIDLVTGNVISEFWCNINKSPGEDVFNGLVYDSNKKTLLMTGKLWNKLYEVVLIK
ncbi:hypothetical protein ENUP19_0256G0005 [Entamoeba nuttalli]|uniref:Glutamine cyclotransferase, putative n=2 Tax=Entamoeba nuttalli TaxID=412467 RepID=K2GE59_ENTNP|nr:glutamine cyclotransferase, putative [Entamoeba nuttalli P19]EKE40871.1 glutamine cyclotransferase, putative [Entamoeba nuttalli P19]|eukprot:XP_008856797.1 glutamine cyclotransferase, putative [Entamoeba nuttalli P19]